MWGEGSYRLKVYEMGYERISLETGINEVKDKYITKQPDNKEDVSDGGRNIEYKDQTG